MPKERSGRGLHLQSRPVQHRGQGTEDIGCADMPGHHPGPPDHITPCHAASHPLVTVTIGKPRIRKDKKGPSSDDIQGGD